MAHCKPMPLHHRSNLFRHSLLVARERKIFESSDIGAPRILRDLIDYLGFAKTLTSERFESADKARLDMLDQEMIEPMIDVIFKCSGVLGYDDFIDYGRVDKIVDLLAELKRRGEELDRSFGLTSAQLV